MIVHEIEKKGRCPDREFLDCRCIFGTRSFQNGSEVCGLQHDRSYWGYTICEKQWKSADFH